MFPWKGSASCPGPVRAHILGFQLHKGWVSAGSSYIFDSTASWRTTAAKLSPVDMKAETSTKEIIAERYPGRVVKHEKFGIWDYYEEKDPDGRVSLLLRVAKQYSELRQCAPYVARMIKDVMGMPGCKARLGVYAVTEHLIALIPALSLWYVLYGHMKLDMFSQHPIEIGTKVGSSRWYVRL